MHHFPVLKPARKEALITGSARKKTKPASFAGIPSPAYTDLPPHTSASLAASPNTLQDIQRQLQEAAQALGSIANAVPQGPQAVYQATEVAAQTSQQSVQKALQQILQLQQQLQQQAAAGAPAFMRQPEAHSTGQSPLDSDLAGAHTRSPAGSMGPAPSAAPALSAADSASKEELEEASASQSLHPNEPAPAQPVAMPSGLPAQDPQHPTSVAEDEVDSVFARTNEADRCWPVRQPLCLSVRHASLDWPQACTIYESLSGQAWGPALRLQLYPLPCISFALVTS